MSAKDCPKIAAQKLASNGASQSNINLDDYRIYFLSNNQAVKDSLTTASKLVLHLKHHTARSPATKLDLMSCKPNSAMHGPRRCM